MILVLQTESDHDAFQTESRPLVLGVEHMWRTCQSQVDESATRVTASLEAVLLKTNPVTWLNPNSSSSILATALWLTSMFLW